MLIPIIWKKKKKSVDDEINMLFLTKNLFRIVEAVAVQNIFYLEIYQNKFFLYQYIKIIKKNKIKFTDYDSLTLSREGY